MAESLSSLLKSSGYSKDDLNDPNTQNIELQKIKIRALETIRLLDKNLHDVNAKRDLGALKEQVKLHGMYLKFQSSLEETKGKNLRAQLQTAGRLQGEMVKGFNRYLEKHSLAYGSVILQAENALDAVGVTAPLSRFDAAFTAIAHPTFDPKVGRYNVEDPKFLNTFRGVLEVADPNGEFIKLNPDGTIASIDEDRLDRSQYASQIRRMAGVYGRAQAQHVRVESDMRGKLDTLDDNLKAAQAALQDQSLEGQEKAAEQIEAYKTAAHDYYNTAKVFGGIGDIKSAQMEIEEAALQSTAYKEALAFYKSLGPGAKANERDRTANMVGDPEFQAWAADHGFDAIGSVGTDKDGNLDPKTYVAGGDDKAAMIMWLKQSRRKPGNYGTKRIRTGEIVTIEMKDGTRLTAERLRRHAADSYGSIRVVTETGARVVTPAEMNRVVVIKRAASVPSRLDVRSRKLFKRKGKDVARAAIAAIEGAPDPTRLVHETGDYIQRPDGTYVSPDELAAEKEQAYQNQSIRLVYAADGGAYIINGALGYDGSGEVYSVDDNGKLTPVDLTQDEEKLKLISAATSRRIGIQDGDTTRLLTAADLEAGQINLDLLNVEDMWDDEGVDPEAQKASEALFDGLVDERRKGINAESLGYTRTTERPDPLGGVRTRAAATIADVSYEDLDEDTVPDDDSLAAAEAAADAYEESLADELPEADDIEDVEVEEPPTEKPDEPEEVPSEADTLDAMAGEPTEAEKAEAAKSKAAADAAAKARKELIADVVRGSTTPSTGSKLPDATKVAEIGAKTAEAARVPTPELQPDFGDTPLPTPVVPGKKGPVDFMKGVFGGRPYAKTEAAAAERARDQEEKARKHEAKQAARQAKREAKQAARQEAGAK